MNPIWGTSLQNVGWHHRIPSKKGYKVVPSRKLHDREITSISDGPSIVPYPWVLGRGSTACFYRHPQRVEEGTKGIISRTGVWKTLPFPAVFFTQSIAYYANVTDFETRLRLNIGKLQPYWRPGTPSHVVVIFKDPTKTSHVRLWKNAILGALQSLHVGPCKVVCRGDTTDAISVHGLATTVFVHRLNPPYLIQHWSRFTSSNSLQHNSFRTVITLSGLPAGTADSPGVRWWKPFTTAATKTLVIILGMLPV